MKYRDTYVEYDKVLADSATTLVDIEGDDPITELLVELHATNRAGTNKNNPIAANISKIELVNGSDALFSLSGYQAMAYASFEMKHLPHREINEWVSNRQVDHFPIRFGRFLGDTELALVPSHFPNLQLRITHNLATIAAIDSGFATGTGRLNVIAKIMENGPVAAQGFLMTKEVESWTNASSGDKKILLPNDYPYRKIYVRSYEAGTELIGAITKLKFTMDGDKFTPFELYTEELARLMEGWFGKMLSSYQFTKDNSDYLALWGDMDIHCWGNTEGATPDILGFRDPWANRVRIQLVDNAGAAGSAESGHVTAVFTCPESTLCYPFGKQEEIADWFDAPAHKDIKLLAAQGDADGLSSVFLQQLRRY